MTTPRAIAMLLGVVLTLVAQPSAVFSQSAMRASSATDSHVAGEVLVKFRPNSSGAQKQSSVALRNHSVLASLTPSGWMHVKIADGQTVAEALAAYQNDPSVEHAQPNYIYRKAAVPNDPQYNQLWGLKNTGQLVNGTAGISGSDINIEKAWDHITDCSVVIVAVLDSGVNYNHEDLVGNMWNGAPTVPFHGYDFVDDDNNPIDGDGHGTHVAGTIAGRGNNGLGVAGVCWRASIMAVRVLDATGSGSSATIIPGIEFALAHGAKVINMSLGGAAGSPSDVAFSAAIDGAQANDVVVVVAAGNSGVNVDLPGNGHRPCVFPQANLLCVAALDQNYTRSSFSNFGVVSVDVGAPGRNIRSLRGVQSAGPPITDDFNNGGMAPSLDWTISGGGWGYRLLQVSGTPVHVLVNPTNYLDLGATYTNNADSRVYREFNVSGNVAAILNFSTQHVLASGDVLTVNYKSSGGDPFAGGVFVDLHTSTSVGIENRSIDISPCISMTCSVGFRLSTNASGTAEGIGVLDFSIDLFQSTNASYVTQNGTSMATPLVAGLATMLRAYNPQFTYVDVVNAIKNGGRSVNALSGITTTGKAIDVMASLAYVNPPAGLSASVVR
jgi:subtilisin family serine protease